VKAKNLHNRKLYFIIRLFQVKFKKTYIRKAKKETKLKMFVHQLVAVLFLKPCSGNYVHHINGISWDNRRQNLKWVTYKENNDYKKGTPVVAIEQGSNMKPIHFLSIRDVCNEYNLDKFTIIFGSWFEHEGKKLLLKTVVSS